MVEVESSNIGLQKRACLVCSREFTDTTTICPDDGTVLTPLVQDPLIGSILAERYEILAVIGGGGMGTVYKARHNLMKRIVAIKMLNPQSVSNAVALKRFQQEAQAASALNHPNILAVFDFGLTTDGQPFLVMDYLEGTNLGVVLQELRHLSIERVLDISIQACHGLAHAHSKGVIHRDLKPGNLMLVEVDKRPDFVKIVDFGIAKLVSLDSDESSHLTTTGEVFGSPLYMSPEQCTGKELDGRSDIYSLGCVLYRALSGNSPFTGRDLLECMYKQVNDLPAHFSTVCPDLCIPDALESIVLKALEKEPANRYQSMDELRADLETLVPTQAETKSVRTNTKESSTSEPVLENFSRTNSKELSLKNPNSTGSIAESASTSSQIAANLDMVRTDPTLIGLVTKIDARLVSAFTLLLALAIVGFAIFLTLPAHRMQPNPSTHIGTPLAKSIAKNDEVDSALVARAIDEFNKGNYSSAQQNAMTVFKNTQKTGKQDPNYSKSLNLLGQVHYVQGAYELARADFEQALPIASSLFGKQSAQVASTQCGLGRVYTALGNYRKAEPLLKQSLAAREKLLGPQDLSVADSLSGLADLALRQGKYNSAVTYLTSALKIRENALGTDNPAVAASLNDLGQAYQLAKNFPEAEELYLKALKIRQSKLAANDPQIANTLICLGSLYAKIGKYDKATTLLKQALSIQEYALGIADPTVAKTRQLIVQLGQHPNSKGRSKSTSFQSWLAK